MWSTWAETLADRLEARTDRALQAPVFSMLGYDPVLRVAVSGGGLAATPMARLRELTVAVLRSEGVEPPLAESAVDHAWHTPDPVALAHPLTDLVGLFQRLHAQGRSVAIATSDDRGPTVATLAALQLTGLVDAVVCADDGVASKPAPDPVLHVCAVLGIEPARCAVVGDSPADLAMGRSAGAALVVGVRTGVGDDADLAAADVVLDSVADLEPLLR